jgi:hypothetical protein
MVEESNRRALVVGFPLNHRGNNHGSKLQNEPCTKAMAVCFRKSRLGCTLAVEVGTEGRDK